MYWCMCVKTDKFACVTVGERLYVHVCAYVHAVRMAVYERETYVSVKKCT